MIEMFGGGACVVLLATLYVLVGWSMVRLFRLSRILRTPRQRRYARVGALVALVQVIVALGLVMLLR